MINIKSISINSIRGIKQLELPLDGKSLIILGENGTGKTSIVDALEYFFTGKISHLGSTQGLTLKDHGTHTKCKPSEVKVTVEFNPGGRKITRTFICDPECPDECKSFFNIAQRGTFILRRSQIMKFIHDRPADRFKEFSKILGFENFDKIEESMSKATNYFSKIIEIKEEVKRSILSALSEILSTPIVDKNNILEILNNRAGELQLEPINSIDTLNSYIDYFSKNLLGKDDEAWTLAFNKIKEKSSNLVLGEEIMKKINEVNNMCQNLSHSNLKNVSVIKILEEAKQVFDTTHDISNCPICENQIDRMEILTKINNNLNILTSISTKFSEIDDAYDQIINLLLTKKSDLDDFHMHLGLHEKSLEREIERIKEIITELGSFLEALRGGKESFSKVNSGHLETISKSLESFSKQVDEKLESYFSKLGLHKAHDLVSFYKLLEGINLKLVELGNVEKEIDLAVYRHSLAEKLQMAFLETKNCKVQEINNLIQEDIRDFYSFMHPDEDHSNIQLLVDFNKRGSTLLKVKSFDQIVDPRAFESEGHLDSLGLCIFLAFVKRFNKDCSLVMLDDIVTTIDSTHRKRICKLLFEYFNDKQLIITTNDNIWYDQFICYQRAYGMQGKFVNKIISKWNVNHGPSLIGYKPRIENIKDKLDAGDKSGAANEIRQYLEWLLKKVCEFFEVKITYKPYGRNTVADLFEPSKSRISKLGKNQNWGQEMIGKFIDVEADTQTLNALSHDNPEMANISVGELTSLLSAIQNLEKAFQCNSCREFLRYDQTSKFIRCINGKCLVPSAFKTT